MSSILIGMLIGIYLTIGCGFAVALFIGAVLGNSMTGVVLAFYVRLLGRLFGLFEIRFRYKERL